MQCNEEEKEEERERGEKVNIWSKRKNIGQSLEF